MGQSIKNCIFSLHSHLSRAKEEAAMRVLTVLSKHRRKVLLLKLMKSLRFIKTLQQTDVRLKELLEVSNYHFFPSLIEKNGNIYIYDWLMFLINCALKSL